MMNTIKATQPLPRYIQIAELIGIQNVHAKCWNCQQANSYLEAIFRKWRPFGRVYRLDIYPLMSNAEYGIWMIASSSEPTYGIGSQPSRLFEFRVRLLPLGGIRFEYIDGDNPTEDEERAIMDWLSELPAPFGEIG